MPSSVMVMKEVDNNFTHFQKPHQTLVGLECRVEVVMYKVWGKKVPSASQSSSITFDKVNFINQDHDVVKVKIKSQNSSVVHTLSDSSWDDDVIELQSMTPISRDDVIELPLIMPSSRDDPFVNTKLKILIPTHELNLQYIGQILKTHCSIVELLKKIGKSCWCQSELHTLNYHTINIQSVNWSYFQNLMGQ